NTLVEARNDGRLQNHMIDEIQEATTRLNRLVGNLLDLTRLESGHVQAKLEWCDVGDLIQTTLRALERELSGREVKAEIAEKIPGAKWDFFLTHRAFPILRRTVFTPPPPATPIFLQARSEPGYLVVSVADRGPGLAPELLPRIFGKFVRGPQAPAG